MRLRGTSSWVPLTVAVRLASCFGVQWSPGDRTQHRQHAVPHGGTAWVGGARAEGDRRACRVDVLPPARMGEAELLCGGGHAVGGAVAGELRQELVVFGV